MISKIHAIFNEHKVLPLKSGDQLARTGITSVEVRGWGGSVCSAKMAAFLDVFIGGRNLPKDPFPSGQTGVDILIYNDLI